jgi:Kef-type K+ transport system membrane component KefB
MKLKPAYLYLAVVAFFAVLFVAFGYLDDDLPVERRFYGSALIIVGMTIALPAMKRLKEDWSRLKPLHSVDLAFLQVTAGIAVLTVACLLGGKAQKAFAPLFNPTPIPVQAPDQSPRNP